jgi:hypothetical protein
MVTGRVIDRSNEEVAAETIRRIDVLVLLNMAMWSILEEKLGVTEAELAERVKQIDLRDGKPDGRTPAQAVSCVSCGRVLPVRQPRCMYCGAESPKRGSFDTLTP